MRIRLPQITLACVASTHIEESREAVNKSQEGIEFGDVQLLTDKNLKSSDEYSAFILYALTDYVKTDYCLLVQYDGYVLRPEKWNPEWFKYDYIGAPWPPNMHFTAEGKEVRVGNGGFSFRSKRLLDAFNKYGLAFTDGGKGFYHEDGQICNYYREFLEKKGFKFAPPEVAAAFSHELDVPETVKEPFGFHRYKI